MIAIGCDFLTVTLSQKLRMPDIQVQELETSTTVLPRIKPPPKSSKLPGHFFYAPSDDGTDENLLILLHGLGQSDNHHYAYREAI